MKREFIPLCCVATIASVPSVAAMQSAECEIKECEKPNIVFYLTEDLSPHFLALFNDGKGCETPNLAALAAKGMIYPNVYSNAPVSSAARTTLITGCYAPSFAGSLHRCLESNPMPEGLRMFPTYLRRAGYYTVNAAKTDYNVDLDVDAWDNIKGQLDSWRARPDKDTPFFLQRTNMVTHESRLLFSEEVYKNTKTRHSTKDVYLLPHTADTELMRYSYATLYDRIEESDAELGELVAMLEEDGEADDTIIFFFGDNGGVTPGTKGYTDNVGVQVPLVVYVPQKWQKALSADEGVVREDLLSFIDFAPTALNMAGVEIPERMDGEPFLGDNAVRGHQSVVCYGDRFDEMYAFNRSIRKGNMRYERHYTPYQTQSLFTMYRYKQLSLREWKELYTKGELSAEQSRFFEPQGVEELFDLAADPNEQNNLAADPRYRAQLEELRGDLNSYMIEKCDLGFFPENIIHEEAMVNPDSYGKCNAARIAEFIAVADLQRLSFADAREKIVAAMASDDAVEQWWGLTVCASFGRDAESLADAARELLTHERSFVRSRATLFLAMLGEVPSQEAMISLFSGCRKDAERLTILHDLTIMLELSLVEPFPLSLEQIGGSDANLKWRQLYIAALYDGTPISVVCDAK